MKINLNDLQKELHKWELRSFGETGQKHGSGIGNFLGVVEEVGELAHAFLKHSQGIRGFDDAKFEAEAKDAIGDITIFLMTLCSRKGWSFSSILEETATTVLKRTWDSEHSKVATLRRESQK